MFNFNSTTTKTFFFDDESVVVALWQLIDEKAFQELKKEIKLNRIEIKSEAKLQYKSEMKNIEIIGIENAFLYISNENNEYLLASFSNLRF